MSAEAKAENTSASAPASGGGGSKLVMILTLVNLVVCLGMGGVLFIAFKNEKNKPQVSDIEAGAAVEEHAGAGSGDKKADAHGAGDSKKAPSDFGKMMQLEQFTVNLSSPGGAAQKFVRVAISVEVPNAEVESEVTSKMPQVRNAIIDLFNSKRANDLATAEGREFLKEEIRSALNSFMTTGKVKGVYFTNFAVTS